MARPDRYFYNRDPADEEALRVGPIRSYRDVARILAEKGDKISDERVRQIEQKVLLKIRDYLLGVRSGR
jgi:hypothetical protein